MTKIDRLSPWQDLPRAPTRSVVPNEDVEAWNTGYGFLKAAQARAQIIEKAARDSGYAAGYGEGLRDGQTAIAEQIVNASAQISSYVNSIDGEVITAVMAAVRNVLGSIPEQELVRRAAMQAIESRLRDASRITVKVHPDVVDGVRAAVQQAQAARPGSNQQIAVEADPGLPSRSSIELHTPFTAVNAGIDSQLSALERVMRARPGKRPGGAG